MRQINLTHIASNHRFAAKPNPCEEHFHLLLRGILRLIQNHKAVIQSAPSHEGQWRNFKLATLKRFMHLVCAHQIMQRIKKWPQIRVNLLRQVTRQKA